MRTGPSRRPRRKRARRRGVRWSGGLPVMLAGLLAISLWKTFGGAFGGVAARDLRADRGDLDGRGDANDGENSGASRESEGPDDGSAPARGERSTHGEERAARDESDLPGRRPGGERGAPAGGRRAPASPGGLPSPAGDARAAAVLDAPAPLLGRPPAAWRAAGDFADLAETERVLNGCRFALCGALCVDSLWRPRARPGAPRPAPRGPPARS